MLDFHSLYQSYAPQVHRFALFLCGDASLADDITSEAFVRAWTSRGKIREATVKAYLFTIARNLYRDHLRRNNRLSELEESIPDSSPGLATRTEHKEELETVMAALRTCGLSGYRNDGEFTIGRHLRDVLSSPLMINNDRILANISTSLLLGGTPASLRS